MSTNDNNRKRFDEAENLKYAVCEQSWYDEQTMAMKKQLGKYGRYLVIVPDFFFDWVDTEKYKIEVAPHAQMFIDECGDAYAMDSNKGIGYTLQRVGEDKDLGTTTDYWIPDKKDVMLTRIVNDFAERIGRAMDAIPFITKGSNGPGRPSKAAQEAEKQAAEPGTPKYIEEERNKIMLRYRDILTKRYHDFAGYNRDRIIKDIKNGKMAEALEKSIVMNKLETTGSLIPCRNCVFDLRTGAPRSAVAEDYISNYAPTDYVPGATDPAVTKFLKEFTCERKDLQDFLGQVLGVALDMNMITRTLLQLWGQKTTNGKSTMVKALMATLGSSDQHGLAVQLPDTAIAAGKNSSNDSAITPSLAKIGDAKVIFVSEPQRGLRVNWAMVKRLTGGDTIQVNQKYKDQYDIKARATMVIDTNHTLHVDDGTVFDRGTIQIAPCDLLIPKDKKDEKIDEKLSTESAKSAWLAWMIEGYKLYLENGNKFSNPPCVQKALDENKLDSDRIGRFIAENYLVTNDTSKKILMTELWDRYSSWCQENGYDHIGLRPEFVKYFENKPNTYTMGERNHQKALCGVVSAAISPLARKPVISGDPVDWYIQNHMKMNSQDKTDEEIQLTRVHADYKKKVEAAGGTSLDIWPLYGVLLGKGFKVTMGAPGVIDEIKVSGWHLKTDAERETERFEKMQIKKNELERDKNQVMRSLEENTRKALDVLLEGDGLEKLLDGAGSEIKDMIIQKLLTGKGWDAVLGDAAAKLMD